jgi:D-alanyl-D-alanine carboxypeptidase
MDMYLYLWIVFIGFILFTAVPLFFPKNRTRWKINQVIVVTVTIILAILAIEFLHISSLISIVFIVAVSILSDQSTYTRIGIMWIGIVCIVIAAGAYYLFHDDPDYVQNYIDNHPNLASMFISVDGKVVVNQEGKVKRPLASVLKTMIAIDYANQVVEGKVDPKERIPLSELDKFYLANTDGGAHPAWLEEMKISGEIIKEEVSLQEVVKGMIKFSSNANTDFLIGKLGHDSINRVIKNLNLENHDPIYPIVAPLLISDYVANQPDKDNSSQSVEEILQSMTQEEYQDLSWKIYKEMKKGKQDRNKKTPTLSLELQKIWSDRLPNASAEDYGKVMSAISNQTATLPGGGEILREVMEWPMELHASNRDQFAHFGAKGGSTAYVLNQALYAEGHDGKKIELIIFTEGFSFIEQIKMNRNMNSFLKEVLARHS